MGTMIDRKSLKFENTRMIVSTFPDSVYLEAIVPGMSAVFHLSADEARALGAALLSAADMLTPTAKIVPASPTAGRIAA